MNHSETQNTGAANLQDIDMEDFIEDGELAEEDDKDASLGSSSVSSNRDIIFAGDTGSLELATRRCLIQLLRGPCLEARRHSKLWSVLLRDEKLIASRLSDLFLTLVIDREQQVAFTRQGELSGVDVPMLLKRRPLTFIESALVLLLRQRLAQSDVKAERAVIARDEMVEHLTLFQSSLSTDHAGFMRRCNTAIEKFKRDNLLMAIPSSHERYEISPILKLVFPAEEISNLSKAYQKLALVPRVKAKLEALGAGVSIDSEDELSELDGAELDATEVDGSLED